MRLIWTGVIRHCSTFAASGTTTRQWVPLYAFGRQFVLTSRLLSRHTRRASLCHFGAETRSCMSDAPGYDPMKMSISQVSIRIGYCPSLESVQRCRVPSSSASFICRYSRIPSLLSVTFVLKKVAKTTDSICWTHFWHVTSARQMLQDSYSADRSICSNHFLKTPAWSISEALSRVWNSAAVLQGAH